MKNLLQTLALLLLTASVWAQAPQKMSFQAVVRDNSNALVTEEGIGIQVSILQGTIDGTVIYQETHEPTTNINGLVTIEIGDGTTSDDFSAIDWSDGPYFIKTEIDPTSIGGTSYSIEGVSQLLGVPYAYYANTAGNVFSGDFNDLTNQPDLTNYDSNVSDDFDGDYTSLTNQPDFTNWDTDVTDDFDGDYTSLANTPDFTGWDTNDADDFSGSYNDLSDVPVNLDIDATDDFDGDYTSLTNQPDFTNWDTDVTNDFDGDYTSLTNQPDFTNWDTDVTDDFDGNYTSLANTPDFTGWDTNDADDFSGSYNDLADVPVNLDVDATDDFDGDYTSLTNQPDFTNWDTDVTDDFDGNYTSLANTPDFTGWDTNDADDFSGSYNDLADVPVNLDVDATDDFDGDYTSLTNQPDFTNWDTDVTDDFDGDYTSLANQPDFTNWDTDVTDDFDGDYTSLANTPDFTGWDTNDADDFSGSYNDLSDVPVNLDIDATDDFDGDMQNQNIVNVLDPVNAQDAATKAYVDELESQVTAMEEILIDAGIYVLKDADGNTYDVIKIGEQVWMSENLKVTQYPNGDPIPYVTDNAIWSTYALDNISDAYCYYNNNASAEADTYGALYTYAAAIGDNWARDNFNGQGVCPDGWHLPSDNEWKTLEMELGMTQTEADNTGARGTDQGSQLAGNAGLWNNGGLDGNANFETSNFLALPAGYRYATGSFSSIGNLTFFWSANEGNPTSSWYRYLYYTGSTIRRDTYGKSMGLSIRCVKN